jgi:hypothetical protein
VTIKTLIVLRLERDFHSTSGQCLRPKKLFTAQPRSFSSFYRDPSVNFNDFDLFPLFTLLGSFISASNFPSRKIKRERKAKAKPEKQRAGHLA